LVEPKNTSALLAKMIPLIPFTKIQTAEIPEKMHEFTTETNRWSFMGQMLFLGNVNRPLSQLSRSLPLAAF